MSAERRSWFDLVIVAILTIAACNSSVRARGTGDGSADAQAARPDTATADAELDRPTPGDRAMDSKNSGPDVVLVRADAAAQVAADAIAGVALTASNTRLSFGSVVLGFSSVRRFTITNRGPAASGTITLTGSGGEFVIMDDWQGDCVSGRTTLAGGASCTVRLAFSPSALGDRAGTLVTSASPGGGVNVALAGTGVTGTLSFLAGAASGWGSADGTGAAARFQRPTGVAVDDSGNLFVADGENHTIRKVTPAGVVSTFAGTSGLEGSVDGVGPAARFSGPGGVAVDKSGNVYVSEAGMGTIRKITRAGEVTTLAGTAGQRGWQDGIGPAARFNTPDGLAVDATGNIFVTDSASKTIRKISPAGQVTTLAGAADQGGSQDGTGANARFIDPQGIALDPSGDLLVADGEGAIRKVTQAGVVTTVTRISATDLSGLAVDGAGNLYVTDPLDSVVRKLTPAGVVTVFAGEWGRSRSVDGTGAAARFSIPTGITLDGSGNLFVTDAGDCAIRMITPAGVVTTLAGALGSRGSEDGTGAAASFRDPAGVAADGQGNLFVTSNQTIRKITPAGVVTTLAGTPDVYGYGDGLGAAARFNYPRGVAVDREGQVFVADSSNRIIRKITPAGEVTILAGAVGKSGSEDGVGPAARFANPHGMAMDSSGNLFVTDSSNHIIRKVTPAGEVTTLAGKAPFPGSQDGTGDAARFDLPSGVALDGAGNLLVTDSNKHTIRKITPAGVVTTLAGAAEQSGAVDGTGSAARFGYPMGVAVDGAGNAFVADNWNRAIRKITPTGVVTTVVGVLTPRILGVFPGPLPASLTQPTAVAFNASADSLYITLDIAVMIVSR